MRQRIYTTHLPGLSCAIAFVAVLLMGSGPVYSQTPRPARPTTDEKPSKSDRDEPESDIGSHEREMRDKLLLKAEKKQYDENLARARETSDLATQLCDAYQARKSFSSEDNKKLERMEKLARKIRNEAGGTETDPDLKDIPAVLESAVKRLSEMADDLRKEVEKTPRHVVSAAVIDQANKFIGLVQFVRNQAR